MVVDPCFFGALGFAPIESNSIEEVFGIRYQGTTYFLNIDKVRISYVLKN